jgi:hypothetical protein
VNRVGYRFTVQRPDGEFVVEHRAYFDTDGDKISWLRIMCSGVRPSSSPPRDHPAAAARVSDPAGAAAAQPTASTGGSPRNLVNTTDPCVENTIR